MMTPPKKTIFAALSLLAFETIFHQEVLAMNCDLGQKQCLDVLSSTPATLPKCYCTNVCRERPEQLAITCASGQLLADTCGTCLKCAKAEGQSCGGLKNIEGECGVGLTCLVRYNVPRNGNGRVQENRAVGTCVDKDSPLCPKASSETLRDGVNCRPGRLGIVAQALYCPVMNQGNNRRQVASAPAASQTTNGVPIQPPPRPPQQQTLVQVLLDHLPL